MLSVKRVVGCGGQTKPRGRSSEMNDVGLEMRVVDPTRGVVDLTRQELLRLEKKVVGHGEGSGVSDVMGGGSGVKWLGWRKLGHQNWENSGIAKVGKVIVGWRVRNGGIGG
ncbi:hypothetical protein Fot_07264 [Forsythia ovata]|uniref:Uncharacterized protein n=1 Tax=Forsythia ovata TaxID=205694 RepID=A0ABD1WW05_9LAMI